MCIEIILRKYSAQALLTIAIGFTAQSILAAEEPVVAWEPVVVEAGGQKYDQHQARIGRMKVPEKRGEASRNIEIAFIHIRSPNPNPGPPVFVAGAGPGGSGVKEAMAMINELPGLIEHRDIVGMDQRGVGLSVPNLTKSFTAEFPGPSEHESLLAAYSELAIKVRHYWEEQGVQLSGYNTWEAAADMDAIRTALGYERIALFGYSYGAHVGLAVLRRYPERIERAAFMAVEGADHTFKTPGQVQESLELVDQLVQADAVLSQSIPSFLSLVRQIIERVARAPVTVNVKNQNGVVAVTVTEWDLRRITAGMLGRRRWVERLPAMYARMDRGDFSDAATEVLRWRRTLYVDALLDVTDCASGASPERLELIDRQRHETILGAVADFPRPEICNVWGIPQLPDSFREPIVSDIPVLLVSGNLDSRTPPSNAREAAASLSNAHFLLVENRGHDVYPGEEVVAFLLKGPAPRLRVITRDPLQFESVTD